MPTLTITLNDSLHNAIKDYVNQNNTSINQLIRGYFAQLTNLDRTKELERLVQQTLNPTNIIYTSRGFPRYVHLNGLAIVLLK
jgi:hypothetical protein